MSMRSWGRKATILVRIRPSAVATRTEWPWVQASVCASASAGVKGKYRFNPVDTDVAEGEGGEVVSHILLDHDRRVQRAAACQKVIEQPRQYKLWHIEQKVDVLGESGPAAHGSRKSADECMADRPRSESVGKHLDSSDQFIRVDQMFTLHGAR